MTANELRIDGKPIPAGSTYTQVGDTLGVYRSRRLGFQLETTGKWDGRIEWNGGVLTHLGPRSRRTLRFDQAIPTPYYIPGHGTEDFRDGGLHGMDMCSVGGSPHDWDNVLARCPVFGIIDIKTGKPRRLASVALPQAGYSLERIGPTSILPEYGPTDEIPYNGQHDLRRQRWTAPLDEFGKRDQIAVARDMALVWNVAMQRLILSEPGGQGSPRVGREFAFVMRAFLDAGDTASVARMVRIATHVQDPYGNLQVNSGGNPAPPPGRWFSDAEAHYQTVSLALAGEKRMARKLGDVCVANGRRGKYIEVGTGRGDQAPTDGTSWAAMACGIYSKDEVRAISGKWKVGPDYNGAMSGPFTDPAALKAKLAWWNSRGKTRWVEAML